MIDLSADTIDLLSNILEKMLNDRLKEYGIDGVRIAITEVKLVVTETDRDPAIAVEANLFANASIFKLLKPGAKKLLK